MKIVISGTDASPVFTRTATTLVDKALLAISAPLATFSGDDKEFFSKDDIGVATLIHLGLGVAMGDKFGASIPLLGGRR